MSFLGEIKRRKVFQVGAVYAVVAWLLVQIITQIETPLSLPDWSDTLVIVLLAIGFPITLIISWAFDVTPEGLIRDESQLAASSKPKIEYLLAGVVIVAIGWLFFRVEFNASDATARTRLTNSIAVLPCDNLSPDPDNAFFAASLHEEILNRLVKLRSLNVIGRTSVLQYAGAARPIPEIADELNVETIMECSVSYADDRIAIAAQMSDGLTGIQLWSERYNRALRDVFAIQADIAVNVANALEANITSSEQATLEAPSTNSPEAYVFYMQALRTPGIDATVQLLEEAIRLDPEFAAAHGRIANNYANSLVDTIGGPAIDAEQRREIEQRTRDHAGRALALDPDEGAAHGALALIDLYRWRWADAKVSFDQALRAGSGTSLPWAYAWWGEPEKTVEFARRNVTLNPDGNTERWALGIAYAYVGDFDAAAASLRESITRNPAFPAAHYILAGVEAVRGNQEVALDEVRLSEELLGNLRVPILLAEMAYVYSLVGATEAASRLLEEIRSVSAGRDIGAGTWAMAYLGAGENERALEQLAMGAEKARNEVLDTGFIPLMNIRMNIFRDPVLERPEFVAVREQLRGN